MSDQERLNTAVLYALRVGCFFPVPEPKPDATTSELIQWGAMRNLHDAMAKFYNGKAQSCMSDQVCQHGTAMDVHCCNCHSGFVFDMEHECPDSMADAAEMLWVVLANVSGGDWTKQSTEWQEAAARWRDNYFAALKATSAPPGAEEPAPQTEVQIAERIARQAHWGQKEESTGDDYIRHIERVVALVEGAQAKAVAWLHDIVEDTPWSLDELRSSSISKAVVDAVDLLTRWPCDFQGQQNYASYIGRIHASGNRLALAVKVADLRDHLRPNCPARLRPRYETALAVLTALDPVSTSPAGGEKTKS